MTAVISDDVVLVSSRQCVARPQKDMYLFYHTRTDELHLVSPIGFYIYQLCDGMRRVGDVAGMFPVAGSGSNDVAVKEFLQRLVVRGILEDADESFS